MARHFTVNPHAFDIDFEHDGKIVAIPEWFYIRELTQKQLQVLRMDPEPCINVLRETEKALQLRIEVEYGVLKLWCPKSILVSEEELRKGAEKARAVREMNDAYYAYLRKTAKDNGVKLGNVQKWDKIKTRLSAAGVSFVEYADFKKGNR